MLVWAHLVRMWDFRSRVEILGLSKIPTFEWSMVKFNFSLGLKSVWEMTIWLRGFNKSLELILLREQLNPSFPPYYMPSCCSFIFINCITFLLKFSFLIPWSLTLGFK